MMIRSAALAALTALGLSVFAVSASADDNYLGTLVANDGGVVTTATASNITAAGSTGAITLPSRANSPSPPEIGVQCDAKACIRVGATVSCTDAAGRGVILDVDQYFPVFLYGTSIAMKPVTGNANCALFHRTK